MLPYISASFTHAYPHLWYGKKFRDEMPWEKTLWWWEYHSGQTLLWPCHPKQHIWRVHTVVALVRSEASSHFYLSQYKGVRHRTCLMPHAELKTLDKYGINHVIGFSSLCLEEWAHVAPSTEDTMRRSRNWHTTIVVVHLRQPHNLLNKCRI